MSWPVARLVDLATAHYGKALKEGKRVASGSYTVFGSSGPVGTHDKKLFEDPTIVIGRKGSVGDVTYAPMGGWPIDTTYYLQLHDPDRLDLRYLYWALFHARLGRRAITTSIPGLNRDDLYRTRVPLPPVAEQRRIAALLDKADRVRRKRRESLRLLGEFLRSAFLEMFGDPVRNEKGWEVVTLGECLEVKPAIGTTTPAQDDGAFTLIRVGDLGAHDVALERCGRIAAARSDLERFRAVPGDLLLARAIGSESHLGKASVLQPAAEPVVFDSHVMRLRVRRRRLHPSFLWQWLQTDGGRRRFLRRAGRTAVQFNVNASQVADVRIALPPLVEQDRFLAFAAAARRMRVKQVGGESSAGTLFDSLAQRAFGAPSEAEA